MSLQHLIAGTVSSADVVLIKDELTLSSRLLIHHILTNWVSLESIPYVLGHSFDSPMAVLTLVLRWKRQFSQLPLVGALPSSLLSNLHMDFANE